VEGGGGPFSGVTGFPGTAGVGSESRNPPNRYNILAAGYNTVTLGLKRNKNERKQYGFSLEANQIFFPMFRNKAKKTNAEGKENRKEAKQKVKREISCKLLAN